MFDLHEKKKSIFFTGFGLQVVHILWKKHKINYYTKKMSGKSWVSLQYELEVLYVNSNARTLFH